jgi:hypothetical protein
LDNPIDDLPRLNPNKRALLEEEGIETIDEIPEDFTLTKNREFRSRASLSILECSVVRLAARSTHRP